MNKISSSAKAGFSGSAGGVDDPGAGTSKQRNVREAEGKKRASTGDTSNTEGQSANRKVAKVTNQPAAEVTLKKNDNLRAANSNISPKAFPLAPPHLTVEILELVNQAHIHKNVLKGINVVLKALNRQNALLVVMAADAKPIEIVLPLTIKCEEQNVPYVYVDDKQLLGRSAGITRPVCACCITPNATHLRSETQTIINKVEKLLI